MINPLTTNIIATAKNYTCAFLSLAIQWKTFDFVEHECKGKTYHYIRIKEKLHFATFNSNTVILIPSDDERITTFVILPKGTL